MKMSQPLAWEAIQGDEPFSVYHEMSFFIEDNNGTYQRFNESHYQRTFEKRNLYKHVKSNRF